MAIDEKQVRHIALLSRIRLTDEEVALFSHQLGDILQYVDKLGRLDTEHVTAMAHAGTHTNVLREDVPTGSLDTAEAIANAPSKHGPFYKVPKVID